MEQQQHGSGVRERTSFLVLTQTVLLTLGELNETQHLLTAQRLYALLEPHVLEVTRSQDAQVRQPATLTAAGASDPRRLIVLLPCLTGSSASCRPFLLL